MTTDAPDGRADPIDVIFRSLDDSDWGRHNLPRLVSLLTHDRARVRLGAGWAITYVAEEHPDTATYLVRRLGDRLADGETSPAVEQAFFGVATRYPDVVDEELPDIFDTKRRRTFERNIGGSMLRAGFGAGSSRHSDVGRVRMPEGGDPSDGQQVYSNDGEDDWWRLNREADDEEGDDSDDDEASDVSASDSGDGGGRRSRGRPARELWAESDALRRIDAASRFDELAVMSERHRDRYADVYRIRAVIEDEELPLSLLYFREPEGSGGTDGAEENRLGFRDDLEDVLARWAVVDDVDGVRTIHDWGREPRPWALVEYADKSLRQRGNFSTDEALWNARHLAASLSHAHENGVVHAGVDPGNVSYHENLLDPEERQIPMLTNVGVLSVVRNYFDPTARLDPRFAAPEYFDRRFGRIDHATDVYGLGALCYLLFTGQPPYRGDYASVRDAVLSPTTPTPSVAGDVPEGLDDVVGKAMATEKLHRYEGVTHMAADLRAIAERDDIGRIYESYPRAADVGGADESEADASAAHAENETSIDEQIGGTADDEQDGDGSGGEESEADESRDDKSEGDESNGDESEAVEGREDA